MAPVRTVYVPRFSAQLDFSRRDEPQPDQTTPLSPCHRGKRGNKRGSVRGAAIDSDSVGGDGFFCSQRPSSKAINEKKKAKLAVLKTISRMLEENQLIRRRLAALSQAN